jgi:hypothetical protein
MRNQGLTYCRKEKHGIGRATRTSKKYCSICNQKIRGINHEQGKFHVQRVAKLEKLEI